MSQKILYNNAPIPYNEDVFILSFSNTYMDKSYIIAFWSPIQTLHPQFCLDYFIPLLQKFGDIQCIDFQSRQDPRTMHLLQQADLVVIGLPADSAYFYSFFCEHWISFSNVCYAILDYFPCLQQETDHLCRQYRIPEQSVLRFPYNAHFLETLRRGKSFFRHCQPKSTSLSTTENQRLFLTELACAARRILNTLDETLLLQPPDIIQSFR